MNRLTRTLALSALACASLGALAQTTPQSIEVRGVRTDVRALCPDVDAALEETLARTVREVAETAMMDVRFELQGNRVGRVAVGEGPERYQRMLRHAVRGLQCDAGDQRPYTVAMRVQVLDPFATPGAGAVALVSLVPAQGPAR
jgi:hypothetical protein